jgi:ABC-type Zn uptake system ZnuABC Zn-binding protein ZnuA
MPRGRALLLWLLAAILAWSAPANAKGLRIVATTSDLRSLVEAVAGDLATVESIVPPGADPEAFEPRPSDLLKLRGADLLVEVGIGYDHWIDRLVLQLDEPRLMRGGEAAVDCSAGIPLLEVRGRSPLPSDGHAHGQANPHYWLDPVNAETITAGIVDGIARVAPAAHAEAVANRERFLLELHARLAEWERTLAPFEGVPLIAYHNSWPYFARRFRLQIADFIEPREGVSPSASRLAALIAKAKQIHVRAVLHEPYEPEDASRLVAARAGIPVVPMATSVGSRPGVEDYLGLIDYDVAVLARALAAPTQ